MSFRVRTYGQGIEIIEGDTVFAPDAASSSGSAGSDLSLVAGAGDGVGDGGSVVITPGLAPGAGANGFVAVSTAAGESDPVLSLDRSTSASLPSRSDMFVGQSVPAFTALAGSLYLLNDQATTGSLYVQTDASSSGSGSTWVDVAGGSSAPDLATVLVAGNTSGNNDIVVTDDRAVRSADQAAGGATTSLTLRTGDVAGGFGNAGNLLVRGGNASSSGGTGGGVTITGGGAGSGISGEVLITGGSPVVGGSGSPGRLIMQSGNRSASTPTGVGVVAGLKAGNSAANTGGSLFLRSGVPASGAAGGTGDIFISTASSQAGIGDPFAAGISNSDTGSITLSTATSSGSDVNFSGNINFTIGSVFAASGNNPGDFVFTGGSVTTANNFVSGSEMTITLGNGTAVTGGGGGSFTVTGGNNTTTDAIFATTGRAGGINLTGGTMRGVGALAFGGPVNIAGGAGIGPNTNGGIVRITGGVGTGTELGGSILLTAGAGATVANNGRVAIVQPGGNLAEVLELDSSSGSDGWVVDLSVSAVQPESVITGSPGDVCFVSVGPGTTGELWLKVSGSGTNTGWQQLQTGAGGSTLQSAYDAGNTIVTAASEGPFSVSGTEAITLSATGDDITIETANTTVPGDVAISGGDATAGPGGNILLTGGTVTAGAGGVGGSIDGTAGNGFGTFEGGEINLTAGEGGATAAGGALTLVAGIGGATSGAGGRADLIGGSAQTDGAGGLAIVSGGNAAGDNDGGTVGMAGGTGSGAGAGGSAILFAGMAGATGNGGSVQLQAQAGGATSGSGGAIVGTAGPGTGSNNPGGSVLFMAGESTGAAGGGGVELAAGYTSTGVGGSVTITAGNATDGSTGVGGGVSITAGNAADTGGSINIFAGDTTAAEGDGGDVLIRGGDITGNGRGGDITLQIPATSGLNGAVIFETTGQDTAGSTYNRGAIVIDTFPSEEGTGWQHRTLVFEGGGTSTNEILTFALPSNDGDNLKVRLWCSMNDINDPDSQASNYLERVFYRDSSSAATLLGTIQTTTITAGAGAGGSTADVVVNGSGDIVIRAIIDASGVDVRFVYMVDYQYSRL